MNKFYSRRIASIGVFMIVFVAVFSLGLLVKVQAQTVPLGTIAIMPDILPDGTVGAFYSETLTASTANGANPFVWSVSGGALPSGLSLASSTTAAAGAQQVVLSGTPTAPGQFTFTISATNYTVAAIQTYVMNIDLNSAAAATSTLTTPTISTQTTVAAPTMAVASSAIQAEIGTLEATVQQLEAELTNSPSPTVGVSPIVPLPPVTCGSTTFCRDLSLGASGQDVLSLQRFLNANGFPITSSGPGSPGNETQYFGAMTQSALAGWQSANGISPASGYFGPKTRVAIEAQVNGSASSSSASPALAPMNPAPAPTTPSPAPAAPIPQQNPY